MPMVFPVFGRGRVLYALVGKSIKKINITKAAQFMTGPCSCLIKEGNPGTDLLIMADWESHIEDQGPGMPTPLPPLPSALDELNPPGAGPPTPAIQHSSTFVTVLIISLVILAFCIALGGIILYRRRSIP